MIPTTIDYEYIDQMMRKVQSTIKIVGSIYFLDVETVNKSYASIHSRA